MSETNLNGGTGVDRKKFGSIRELEKFLSQNKQLFQEDLEKVELLAAACLPEDIRIELQSKIMVNGRMDLGLRSFIDKKGQC